MSDEDITFRECPQENQGGHSLFNIKILSLKKLETAMNKKTVIFIGMLFILAFAACTGGKNKSGKKNVIPDPRKSMTMERTARDTSELLRLSTEFLDLVKSHNVSAALDRIYEVKNNKVNPLSETRRKQLEKTLSAFPVEDYTIDEMVLYSDSDTEVRYTIEMFKNAPGDKRPNTIKCSLNPYRIGGNWYMTIADEKIEPNFKDN